MPDPDAGLRGRADARIRGGGIERVEPGGSVEFDEDVFVKGGFVPARFIGDQDAIPGLGEAIEGDLGAACDVIGGDPTVLKLIEGVVVEDVIGHHRGGAGGFVAAGGLVGVVIVVRAQHMPEFVDEGVGIDALPFADAFVEEIQGGPEIGEADGGGSVRGQGGVGVIQFIVPIIPVTIGPIDLPVGVVGRGLTAGIDHDDRVDEAVPVAIELLGGTIPVGCFISVDGAPHGFGGAIGVVGAGAGFCGLLIETLGRHAHVGGFGVSELKVQLAIGGFAVIGAKGFPIIGVFGASSGEGLYVADFILGESVVGEFDGEDQDVLLSGGGGIVIHVVETEVLVDGVVFRGVGGGVILIPDRV